MNRQTKRAMAKQEKAQQKAPSPARKPAPPQAAGTEKTKRASLGQFLREVRLELKKVQWPTRKETVSYTIVVLVTVGVMTLFVFGLDLFFSNFVLKLFLNS